MQKLKLAERRSLKKVLFLILITFFILDSSLAQPPTGQIQRAEEILEKERILRKKLEVEKVFIKKIIVKGATLISEDELRQIILPFQKKWLKKEDIQQILDLIELTYKEKNIQPEISYQIKKQKLIILIKEIHEFH